MSKLRFCLQLELNFLDLIFVDLKKFKSSFTQDLTLNNYDLDDWEPQRRLSFIITLQNVRDMTTFYFYRGKERGRHMKRLLLISHFLTKNLLLILLKLFPCHYFFLKYYKSLIKWLWVDTQKSCACGFSPLWFVCCCCLLPLGGVVDPLSLLLAGAGRSCSESSVIRYLNCCCHLLTSCF